MIDLQNLSVQFSGEYLFKDVNLKILQDDKIALVGSNGTGKSTLLKIISGKNIQESGEIHFKKDIKIGYLPQELISDNKFTVFDEVRKSIDFVVKIDSEEEYLNEMLNDPAKNNFQEAEIIERLGLLNHRKEQSDYYEINSIIEKILMGLGFSQEDLFRHTSELSGGWLMRVELAKILVADNDIILLDEPTNHLDIDSLRWLIKFLENFRGALILVSHDRYFINSICSKTLEIFNGKITFYKGTYDNYLSFKEVRAERLKAEHREQQKKIKQTEEFIERFRYKATKAKQVQSRVKQLEKIERISLSDSENNINFRFFDTPPSGVIPLRIKELSKSYDEKQVLKNIDLQIERGEKIALVGPNGAGKTTFAKLISGRLDPDSGTIETAHNTVISYYAQDVVDNLNIENDILTEIANNDNENTTLQLRTILGAFLFQGDDVRKKISVLSGGEKSRVALAKVLLQKANTIILDEPTNHLDFESKKIVQNALSDFNGTLIIVSHDIDFLKPITTKVIEFGNKSIREYYGGIEYYLTKKDAQESVTFESEQKENPEKINRKLEKRIAAEKRQREYSETKDLKERVSHLENEIEKLELERDNLELAFTKEEVYSNPAKAKENRIKFENVQNELDRNINEWSAVSEALEEIQKKFT